MKKYKVEDFIEILGCTAIDSKVQTILKELDLMTPVLDEGKDIFWYELEKEGLDLAFKDESIINNDEYADIGDGELIFMTAYFTKFDNIELPFKISEDDNYQKVLEKIGKEADDQYDLLSEISWIFTQDNGIEYTFFLTFDKEYSKIKKSGIIYSYGQLPWVEELKNNG